MIARARQLWRHLAARAEAGGCEAVHHGRSCTAAPLALPPALPPTRLPMHPPAHPCTGVPPTGWDYSTRWFADGQTLETIRTTLVIPAGDTSVQRPLAPSCAVLFCRRSRGLPESCVTARSTAGTAPAL